MESLLEQPIRELVSELASAKYADIVFDGRAGRLTAQEMSSAISEYGRTLLPLPENAFDLVDFYPIDGAENEWSVDVPLWTKEEGRSDLTLSLSAKIDQNKVIVEIDDIHVL
jgi:hypothetical protein